MAKSKQLKEGLMGQRAAPVRALLSAWLREQLQTAEDRRRLVRFLGVSESYVKQMLYNGEGGLDAWIGALLLLLDVDAEGLGEILGEASAAARRRQPLKASDQVWLELDDQVGEDQKHYWANLVRAAVALEAELGVAVAKGKKKKRATRARKPSK